VLFSPPVGCADSRPKSLNSYGARAPGRRTAVPHGEARDGVVGVDEHRDDGAPREYLTALLIRLSTTWRILLRSTSTMGSPLVFTISMRVLFFAASMLLRWTDRSTISTTLVGLVELQVAASIVRRPGARSRAGASTGWRRGSSE